MPENCENTCSGLVRLEQQVDDLRRQSGANHKDFRLQLQEMEKEDDMTQEQFNQMFKTAMDGYRQELRDNDCGQWSQEAREYAVSSGLFAGSGTTPDGQPNFMWEDLLTREQCAQLFYRFAQQHGLT